MAVLRWAWLWIAVLALLFSIGDLVATYPKLPARVAIHFNAAGQPDGWGPRSELLVTYVMVLLIIVGISAAMPLIVRYAPASLINIPNKNYWFVPERESETRGVLLHRIGWFACATVLLAVAINRVLLHANLQPPVGVSRLLLYIGLYFGFVILWLIDLTWRFRVPKSSEIAGSG